MNLSSLGDPSELDASGPVVGYELPDHSVSAHQGREPGVCFGQIVDPPPRLIHSTLGGLFGDRVAVNDDAHVNVTVGPWPTCGASDLGVPSEADSGLAVLNEVEGKLPSVT